MVAGDRLYYIHRASDRKLSRIIPLLGFKPVKVLKGPFRRVYSKLSLRSILVIIQFRFGIILIIATVIVSRQMKDAQQRDNGYTKNGLICTPITGQIDKNYTVIKNDLLTSGAVTAVSKSMSPITRQYSGGWGGKWPGSTPQDEHINFSRFSSTDADFVKTDKIIVLAISETCNCFFRHYCSDRLVYHAPVPQ